MSKRLAEWLDDELTRIETDETMRRGEFWEITRTTPKPGEPATTVILHPLDVAAWYRLKGLG